MAARIRGNKELSQPLLNDGSPNALFLEQVYMYMRGYEYEVRGGGFVIGNIDDYKDFDLTRLLAFVAAGAEVVNYPCWIRLSENKWPNEDVPNYMPNFEQPSDPDDPESPLVQVKWQNWMNRTNTPTVVPNEQGDPIYYVQTSGSDNRDVDGDIIALLDDGGNGYGLRSEFQMQRIVADAATPIP